MGYTLLAPIIRTADAVYTLHREGDAWLNEYLEVHIDRSLVDTGREKLCVHWINRTKKQLRVQLELALQADFAFTHYVIPGVSLNGNDWGRGKEPKTLALDGEPWVFDSRRTTIPACTISENNTQFLALMASDQDDASLRASCSMVPQADGAMRHRLLYPFIERPVTYCTRDGYAPAHEEWITLAPGAAYITTAYVLTGRPVCNNFATANVEDAALDLLGRDFSPRYTAAETADLCCRFARRLVMQVNGRAMFSIGQLPTAEGVFENREGNELGWCGQNGLYARLMLARGLERQEQELIDIAVSNLDAWSHEAVGRTGLIHTHYHWLVKARTNVEDTCNQGFALCELTKAWETARAHGLEKDDWLKAAKGAAEFLVDHWSEQNGFGKAWDVETGVCTDPQGTIGAYVIPGLTALYRATGEPRWLNAARRACRFYRDRDLAAFQCTAGALDTYCIDKEPSGPLLAGALDLYGIDGTQEWLECARMAGWYFCSWMFHHDVTVRPGSDFDVYGYRTLGGTSVSAQHHHIDPWGALVVPQMMQLWRLTGDEHWRTRANLMWANAIQNIAPEEGCTIHGHFRAAGAQNEGYHHCCWGEDGAPGYVNEWLVAWPQAYCWLAAETEAAALPVPAVQRV